MSGFPTRLRKESAGWVEDGLITGPQREALLVRHPEAGPARLLGILGAVGGALVLAGVCLLIGSNWERIDAFSKIAGVILLTGAAHAAGWRLGRPPGRYPRLGDTAHGLGCGFFVAGVALVSQIYHLDARLAGYALCAWLGIAAVPWLTGSRTAQALSVATALTWLVLETTTRTGWLRLGSREEFWLLAALAVPVGIGLWCFGLSLRATVHARFAALHEMTGIVLCCGALYVLGFFRHDGRAASGGEAVAWAPVAVAGILLAAGFLPAWRRAVGELRILALWFGICLVPAAGVLAGWDLQDRGWLWSGLAWASLFALNIAMIRAGLAAGRPGWVNVAVPCIGLNVFTRYFDLFGTMLEGGVFFVVTGLVMLAVVYYLERKRRSLVAGLHVAASKGGRA